MMAPLPFGQVNDTLTEASPKSDALMMAPLLPSGDVNDTNVPLNEASPKSDHINPAFEHFVQNVISNVVKNLKYLAHDKDQKGLYFFLEHIVCFAGCH